MQNLAHRRLCLSPSLFLSNLLQIFLRKQRLLSLSEGYLESGSSSSTSSASRISLEVLQELRGHFPFHF